MPVRMLSIAAVALAVILTACTESTAREIEPTPRGTIAPVSTTGTVELPPTAAPAETPASTRVPSACAPPYPSGPRTAETVFCADPSAMQRASVVRIVDGDTIRVMLDGVEEAVRFFGVNTTERGEACFTEATEFVRMTVALYGGQVLLVPDERNRDRYDRLLRYVYTPDGLSIDALLIADGYGRAWTDDGVLRDALVELEAIARDERRGCLWR